MCRMNEMNEAQVDRRSTPNEKKTFYIGSWKYYGYFRSMGAGIS